MSKTCECGAMFNEEGVCVSCGLIDDEYAYLRQYKEYPFDPDKKNYQHGDVRTHAVSDISVMTMVNPSECSEPHLKRALQWDKNFEWNIIKTEIINSTIKHVCSCLGINHDFTDRCHYFFRKIKDKTAFTGKLLENAAAAIVYTIIRLDALPYSLYDFRLAGFDTTLIYKYYIDFIKQWELINYIQPQDTQMFVTKFINSLVPDNQDVFRDKFELIQLAHSLFQYYYATFSVININNLQNNVQDLTLVVNNSGLPLLASIVYSLCKKHTDIKITQREIAEAAGVTEVTIRNYLKKIKGHENNVGE